jgi:hypothetical protein
VLEVEGSPDNASLPAEAAETLSNRTLDATNFAPADSVPAEIAGEHPAANSGPRETRTYKGAVYEKREDGQWHLQKN